MTRRLVAVPGATAVGEVAAVGEGMAAVDVVAAAGGASGRMEPDHRSRGRDEVRLAIERDQDGKTAGDRSTSARCGQ